MINKELPAKKEDSESTLIESIEHLKENLNESKKSRSRVSDPSVSVDDVNVPEVKNQTAEFVYNFYDVDERVSPYSGSDSKPLSKFARYVLLKWTSPIKTAFESSKQVSSKISQQNVSLLIQDNVEKVVSEDNFFNPGYVNHTFSDVAAIEQGASDLENFSRINYDVSESVFKMSKSQIEKIAKSEDASDDYTSPLIGKLAESYATLSDFPNESLGLRVYSEDGNVVGDDDMIRSITDNLSLTMKINSKLIPDVFVQSSVKEDQKSLKSLKAAHVAAVNLNASKDGLFIVPIYNDFNKSSASNLTNPVKFVGYIIDRYIASKNGFTKDDTFYIEDISQTHYVDKTVLYGVTYIYAVRVVAAIKVMTYNSTGTSVDVSTIYVSSRPVSVPIECFEYCPPPPPDDLKFVYDYRNKSLVISWDTQMNPQRDIKQFQVMRRKSIREPFELIAQYGFDTTTVGHTGSGKKYTTGERVDANNVEEMLREDLHMVHVQDAKIPKSYPVKTHTDRDFTVDTEFYVSSEYIYAVCSIDAHGMISNYSSQHYVTFDPYKNRLVTSVVCDSGSPRQYPNMNLRHDAFKDAIVVSGDDSRKLEIYFTPEYFRVRDENNVKYKIVEAQTTNTNPHYVLQFINLDNQKTQQIRINIKDPQLTTEL